LAYRKIGGFDSSQLTKPDAELIFELLLCNSESFSSRSGCLYIGVVSKGIDEEGVCNYIPVVGVPGGGIEDGFGFTLGLRAGGRRTLGLEEFVEASNGFSLLHGGEILATEVLLEFQANEFLLVGGIEDEGWYHPSGDFGVSVFIATGESQDCLSSTEPSDEFEGVSDCDRMEETVTGDGGSEIRDVFGRVLDSLSIRRDNNRRCWDQVDKGICRHNGDTCRELDDLRCTKNLFYVGK
jgi:hypothetical protein